LFGRQNILRGARGWPDMARGFPYKLQCHYAKLLKVGERLLQLAPFTELQLLDMTSSGLEEFVGATWTGGLRTLGLSGGYGSSEPDWAALADGKHFKELRDLAIVFGWIDRAAAARIAATKLFPKLERFYFGTYSDDDAPAALFSGKTFTGLRSLELSGGGRSMSDSPMPGLKEICESRALRSLKVFDMGWRPTPNLTAMLTASTFWPGLEELDLLRNNLGNRDLAAMLNRPSKLRRLELADNKITAKGAELLAEHPALANITTLDLSDNAIGDRGVTALVNSPHARNLQKLEISTCGFGLAGVTAIAESPHLANLRELWMNSNGLDLKGARLLAASPHLANLDWLYLGGGLTATARKALKERFGDRVSV
jgi:Leucine Rich repeat